MAGQPGRSGGRNRKVGPRTASGRLKRDRKSLCACGALKCERSPRCQKCYDEARHARHLQRLADVLACACGNRKSEGSSECLWCSRARRRAASHRCERCTAIFVRVGRGERDAHRFCSRACAFAWKRDRGLHPCSECQILIPRINTKRCGACLAAWRARVAAKKLARQIQQLRIKPLAKPIALPKVRAMLPPPTACLDCGAVFIPTRPRQRFCSHACARRMGHRRAKYKIASGLDLPPDHELIQLRRLFGRLRMSLYKVAAP